MMKKVTISVFFLFTMVKLIGQESQFSQFYSASLYTNPAFAGIYSSPNININYRQQAPSNSIRDILGQASFIYPLMIKGDVDRQIGGIGATAFNNQRGIQGMQKISGYHLTYAQNIRLNPISPDMLSFAVQGGMEFVNISFSDLRWGSQYNPYIISGQDDQIPAPVTEFDQRANNFVVNAGIIYYYNRQRNYLLYNYSAFSGISVNNINRPDKSLNKDGEFIQPMLFKYHGALEFKMGRAYLMPSVLAIYQARNFQFNGGAYISVPTNRSLSFSLDSRGLEILAGVWYRFKDSFIFILGFNDDQMGARVSYDLNSMLFAQEIVSGNDLIQPAFEVSFQYNFNSSKRIRKVSNPLF
jgi:type IX secretion system PorP/SprF family membrane protein